MKPVLFKHITSSTFLESRQDLKSSVRYLTKIPILKGCLSNQQLFEVNQLSGLASPENPALEQVFGMN